MNRNEDLDSAAPLQANPGYALLRWQKALETAQNHSDKAARSRASEKLEKWQAILNGMSRGELKIGSRTPIADAPPWITLEVAQGGFATGAFLAEGPLQDYENSLLEEIPASIKGDSPRHRLNLYFCSDEGQQRLLDSVLAGQIEIKIPEEGALAVAAWLSEAGRGVEALELLDEIHPWMDRLRFYPRLRARPQAPASCVFMSSAHNVASAFENRREKPAIRAERLCLSRWLPLYDRLVSLWLETVEGDAPKLSADGQSLEGGWPCARFPKDWSAKRRDWFKDESQRETREARSRRRQREQSPAEVLRRALERCPTDSSALDGRSVGRIRWALARATARHGLPGSEAHKNLRANQASALPKLLHAQIAQILALRLRALPAERGISSMELVAQPIQPYEANDSELPSHTEVPSTLQRKMLQALEAPVDELVRLGVISSGETLARVAPQLSAAVLSAGLSDPQLRGLYTQIMLAFRNRRSLLLLNYASQVKLEELPWIQALEPLRSKRVKAQEQARETLSQLGLLALSSFPETITPNVLVSLLEQLAKQAKLELPLVNELAADIFMGSFMPKWRAAARLSAEGLEGSLYARYYDLPPASHWGASASSSSKSPKLDSEFAALCIARAAEAGPLSAARWRPVAENGAILEQSQILTTHNLGALCFGLEATESYRRLAEDLCSRTLTWIVRRAARPMASRRAALLAQKRCAYAWRQAIFFASLLDEGQQRSLFTSFKQGIEANPGATRWRPVVLGIEAVLDGARFDEKGEMTELGARRALGWSLSGPWLFG